MNELKIHKNRNSLIELYRFLFAINVVIGHGLFPIPTEYWGPARISVEFFFILSGYLFFNSLEKLKGLSVVEAVKSMLKSKIKPILVPTVIGIISNIVYNFAINASLLEMFKIFKYLWYIPAMLAAFLVYTILRVLLKDHRFWLTVAIVCIICTLLRFSGNQILHDFDYIRSFAAVSLGILLAKVPKLQIKHKVIWWLVLIPILASVVCIVRYYLADIQWFGGFWGVEAILDLILYPLLIYVSFRIDFNFPIFNYLGALSFGIYAYQCPARMLWGFGIYDKWMIFAVIIVMSVSDDFIKRIVKAVSRGSLK